MPEQDRLGVVFAPGFQASGNLAELGVQRLLAQPPGLDMGA